MAGAVDTKTTILALVLTVLFLATAMIVGYLTRSGAAVAAVVGGYPFALAAVGLVDRKIRAGNMTVALQGPTTRGGRQRQRWRLFPWRG